MWREFERHAAARVVISRETAVEATQNKSRDGGRPLSGWGARQHVRWPQTWQGDGEDLQRGELLEIGMRDASGCSMEIIVYNQNMLCGNIAG
jgi:hypothetical protein